MTISLVVAAAENEVIGRDGMLPWYLPADLRRFRELTTGHVVVMGRLTYESIIARLGHPLDGRTSVVISSTLRDPGDERVVVAHSVESALAQAAALAARPGPAAASCSWQAGNRCTGRRCHWPAGST